jgi:hypothetical protein
MLPVVPTPTTERRLLQMPHYESLNSVRGLRCFKGVLRSAIFETVTVLCWALWWMPKQAPVSAVLAAPALLQTKAKRTLRTLVGAKLPF